MMLIFFHVYFAPFPRLKRAVSAEDWNAGGGIWRKSACWLASI
jgi:hypothetical protein